MKPRVGLVSLGCAKNLVDSEVMLGVLNQQCEITHQPEEAHVLIVNTCGFIDKAKEESINTIVDLAQYKETGNCRALIVTGCMAQKYSQELIQEIPEIDAVIGTGKVEEIADIVQKAMAGERVVEVSQPDYLYSHNTPRVLSTPKYSAYVKIADGCDNKCCYCVIPELRGSYRSRPLESIVAEVEQLAEGGVKEIMLIAQDTTRYGLDIYQKYALPELIKQLDVIPGIEWIRLLYCYPTHFTDELIQEMKASDKVCHYIDLPIQHAHDSILKTMNRRGTQQDIRALIAKLRDNLPDIALRTSFIVGLPGETDVEFQELLSFMQDVQFDKVGVFTYSQEEGTPAAAMDHQVDEDTKLHRQQQAMELQSEISLKKNQQRIGAVLKVLVEGIVPDNKELFFGRSQYDAPDVDGKVYFRSADDPQPGDMVLVKITDAFEYDLMGDVFLEPSK